MSRYLLSRVGWYLRRLGRMSPAEIAWRVREQAVRRAWKRRQVRPGDLTPRVRFPRRGQRTSDGLRPCSRSGLRI